MFAGHIGAALVIGRAEPRVNVGLFIAAGLLRMGFITNFLAEPALQGFLFGMALIIVVRQADGGSFSDAHLLRLLLGRKRE